MHAVRIMGNEVTEFVQVLADESYPDPEIQSAFLFSSVLYRMVLDHIKKRVHESESRESE